MLLTPLIKRQLRIFAVLAVVALGMAFFNYARVPAMLGIGVYDVSVEFADASGLYPKASVTYRGVKVGIVSDLEVSDAGAVATLRIDNGTDIPADVRAELHSTSAIGEQYVDLVHEGDVTGDLLAQGASIPRERATDLPQIAPVLDSLNRLLESVPREETRAVLAQVDDGLGGTGPELNELVQSSATLLAEAQTNVRATRELISALQPVLETQRDLGPSTRSWADSLDDVTAELARDDSADLRALLADGPGGLDAATGAISDQQEVLPMLLANLTTNAEVLNTYLPELRQTLVVYPATVARVQSAVNPRAEFGDVQLDLRGTLNDPPTCITGYVRPDQRRSPSRLTTRDVDHLAHCKIAPDNPAAVRGARNLPCPEGDLRGPLPASCGLEFGTGVWPETSGKVAYDLAVGKGGDDSSGSITVDDETTSADDLWTLLVLGPLTVGGRR
ncbi:phospholipid/cholesterol/gamma-HCH transport system substrate-binding protein [Nocardioides sp. J9]|uniref:MCE family protein n=1 Tax=Nocardioides sp. J9 TaxID=935844 RepID=UPI0011A22B80|nr:MCE family protein [Nocardioides sp. J9]TWG91556.1 phospholipid/cholesterol/gamma-HCH transport system substrate-binding protein [Nocardioides sp. J9]